MGTGPLLYAVNMYAASSPVPKGMGEVSFAA